MQVFEPGVFVDVFQGDGGAAAPSLGGAVLGALWGVSTPVSALQFGSTLIWAVPDAMSLALGEGVLLIGSAVTALTLDEDVLEIEYA